MAYILREEIYEIKRNNDLSRIEEYCKLDKSNAYIHLEYARMLISNEKYAEAKQELKSISNTKYRIQAVYELGKIALINKDYNLASDHFHFVEDNSNHQADVEKARYAIAKLNLECEKLKESKKYFKKLLGTSYEEKSKLNLGRICYQLEEYEESRDYLKDLIDSDYDYVARFDLAKSEYALGNTDVARYYFQTSMEMGNNYSIYELAKLEYNDANYKEAEELFKKSNYSGVYLYKTKYLLGKKEEAIEGLKSLINTKDDFSSRINLSIIYIKDKKYEEAFDLIYNVINYDKTDCDVRVKIALVLLKELGISCYRVFPDINGLSYSDKLLAEYDETEVLSHITKNHTNHKNKNNFSEDIDIFDLFYNIKENLVEETKSPTFNFNDTYHINYPNVGNNGESLLRVVTLPGTKEIVTMYPVFTCRDEIDESEEDNIEYSVKASLLLQKLANLNKLSEDVNFDYADALSDSEKLLLSEMFALQDVKTKKIFK